MDGPTDGQTDEVSFRVTRTHLKTDGAWGTADPVSLSLLLIRRSVRFFPSFCPFHLRPSVRQFSACAIFAFCPSCKYFFASPLMTHQLLGNANYPTAALQAALDNSKRPLTIQSALYHITLIIKVSRVHSLP